MNCLECQDQLQRRLDGTATPTGAVEQHLAQCPSCREQSAAAGLLLDALKALPRPQLPPHFARSIADAVVRDRVHRRHKMRRRLLLTAALAASVLLILLAGSLWLPGEPLPPGNGPVAESGSKKSPVVPHPAPVPQPEPKTPREEPRHALASLTERLADSTRDHAKVLWTAANPMGDVPVEPLGAVAELEALDPAKQSLRQASEEVRDGVQTVARSARRALDYFARELPVVAATE